MRNTFHVSLLAVSALAASLSLSGCANEGASGGNEVGGTMLGAALGGLLGSQMGSGDGRLAATALGTLGGAYLGNQIGRKMDQEDRRRLRDAESRAYSAPLNEPIIWNNPNSGNSGTNTPIRDWRSQGGSYCREFQSEIVVGGERQKAHGTACREPDGTWRIVS